jgi:hypothetical protein
MSKVIKATVMHGRYKGEIVRVTNISLDESGQQKAACFLMSGQRANIPVKDLEMIEEKPAAPEVPRAKSSMPFVSGSTGSRTMTQTRNMQKPKIRNKSFTKEESDEEE